MSQSLACVILAAGQGTRMKSSLAKVLHPVAGRPMVAHVVAACAAAEASQIAVVVAPGMGGVRVAVAPHACVVQERPLGTGDAAKAARKTLEGFNGDILILFGDTPLLTTASLAKMCARRAETGAAIVVSGFEPADPAAYGRLIVGKDGTLDAIVEFKEATPEQKAIRLCNGGMMLFDSACLWQLLDKIDNKNAKGEYYLTDAIALARAEGLKAVVASLDEEDLSGVNSKIELAAAEAVMQKRLRDAAMLAGVTMTDPSSVFLCADTELAPGVSIEPNVVFGPGVKVGANVAIKAFCHIEQATIEPGAQIGPFARLRPGAKIGEAAHIGNFVEIKKSVVEAGAKVNHLTYIGDARIGAKANIGAGTITCNYDGFTKAHTDIGAGAFIGSNTALVAPVKIGDGAIVGAGSTITKEVPADSLAVTRAKMSVIEGWAAAFRAKKQK